MKKKIFILFIFIFMLFSVASCSSSDEESILIESISSEVLSDGRTQITIKYQNEDMKDSVFYLPKGKDGTGIEDFVYKIDTEKNTTDITFSFTDVFEGPLDDVNESSIFFFSIALPYPQTQIRIASMAYFGSVPCSFVKRLK